MTLQDNLGAQLGARQADPRLSGIIKLAILAVGGQGGGVLTGWIEDLARAQGWAAQATSVAGVSQRTGAGFSSKRSRTAAMRAMGQMMPSEVNWSTDRNRARRSWAAWSLDFSASRWDTPQL